ncbi:MAG: C25 family cysteine peptidase, partial [Planctomycetota bacterium]
FDPIYKNHMINAEMIHDVDYNALRTSARAGEAEYAIIIPETVFSQPSSSYRKSANALKEFRMQQGIVTEIYTLSDTGTSASQIENWINNAVQNRNLPPVGVLLLADAPGETQYTIPVPSWSSTPSDNIYADVYGNDDLPDIMISRICAKSSNDVEEMVGKIIDYETHPPMDPGFYNCPTIAAGWQSDRWFVICADIVHGYFEHKRGLTPHREYSGTSSAPTYWSTNTNTPLLVAYFGPLGTQYIPATPSHLTDWGGNATRINADFNAGSFFALHRDHGSPSGWSDPSYTTSNILSLTNDPLLPFVLSINCSSGAFTGTTASFAEAMYRMHHGAVGLIAASATSYSFVNDVYVFGMMDSLFPDFDPWGTGIGSPLSGELMSGVAHVSGKYYLEASDWPYNPQSKTITYHLFHLHGTPFFTLCSEVPQALNVTHASTLDFGATTLQVTVDENAQITVSVKDAYGKVSILGTAVGTGSPVGIALSEPQTEPRVLTVVVTKPNHIRYMGHVYVPEAGTLTQYGSGLAGTGGFVPELDGTGVPIFSGEFKVDLTQGLGGASALMYLGLASSNYPFMGGHLLVYPVDFTIPLVLGGSGAGGGGFSIPVEAFLMNVTLYVQVFNADPEAPFGVAMSNGLEIHFP